MSFHRDKSGGGAGAIAALTRAPRSAPSVIVSRRGGRDYRDLGAISSTTAVVKPSTQLRSTMFEANRQLARIAPGIAPTRANVSAVSSPGKPANGHFGFVVPGGRGGVSPATGSKIPASQGTLSTGMGPKTPMTGLTDSRGTPFVGSPGAPDPIVSTGGGGGGGGGGSYGAPSSGASGAAPVLETFSPIVVPEDLDEGTAVAPPAAKPAPGKFPWLLVGGGLLAAYLLTKKKRGRP